jgi:SOCE-associated regulatory factor of calcium homoeostasis
MFQLVSAGRYEKIRLRDVEVLTLHQGAYTTARRSSAVPQVRSIRMAFKRLVCIVQRRKRDHCRFKKRLTTEFNFIFSFQEAFELMKDLSEDVIPQKSKLCRDEWLVLGSKTLQNIKYSMYTYVLGSVLITDLVT